MAWISFAVLLWAIFALIPHTAPYNQSLVLNLTLIAWSTPVWVFICFLGVVLMVLVTESALGYTRLLLVSVFANATVSLTVGLAAVVYISLLDLTSFQDMTNGRLKLCRNYCGSPYVPCVHEPVPVYDLSARTATKRAVDAVTFFRANIYGAPISVSATASEDFIDVVFGTTGLAVCATRLVIPGNGTFVPILLVIDGTNRHTRALASKYGFVPLGLPKHPRSICGSGGQIANEAAVANSVATALFGLGFNISLYGCSRSGKIAVWASATLENFFYHTVLVDSGGTLGFASIRQVGRCGEPFSALVDRWPEWLGDNASMVKYIKDWPIDVDTSDLVLKACVVGGTRYAVSTSSNDLWNNPNGLIASVDAAKRYGCSIRVITADGRGHCNLF